MTRTTFALLTLPAVLAAPLAAQDPPARSELAANAALKYWQAFAHLPPREEAQLPKLGDWRTVPLDAAARRLVADSQNSFLYLRRGAALPRCDWALNYEDGIGLLLPQLAKARTLALLACLRTRVAVADGTPADALDDVLAAFTLGRHIADPIMISLLVDYSIELNAVDAAALLLPKLDAAGKRRLAERLDALPKAATLEQTLVTERDYFGGWAIRWLKDLERAGARDIRAKVRGLLVGSEGQEADELLALVEDTSAARLVQALEALGPMYEEQRRLVGLPRAQFLAQWPEHQRKQQANPAARVMLPAVSKMVDGRDRQRANVALLRAAVAVSSDGPAALAKHPDPFGTGPFEHTPRGNGFELRSQLTHEGKPIVLKVGE